MKGKGMLSAGLASRCNGNEVMTDAFLGDMAERRNNCTLSHLSFDVIKEPMSDIYYTTRWDFEWPVSKFKIQPRPRRRLTGHYAGIIHVVNLKLRSLKYWCIYEPLKLPFKSEFQCTVPVVLSNTF